jgi:uncharacterized protein (UPF0548 family)
VIIGGLRFPTLQSDELDRLLAEASVAVLTYDHVGSTLTRAGLPTWRRALGDDADAFDRAAMALRTWAPQRRLGAHVHPDDVALEPGATLLVVLRIGPFEVAAPVRVVDVIDEPDRFGFVYGTLRGHPECGEEAFLVEREADGSTDATIVIDARPGTLPAKLASPVVTVLQRRAVQTYLDALQ